MTRLLKTILPSLVIATCVTAPSFAKGSGIYTTEWSEVHVSGHAKLFESAAIVENVPGKMLADIPLEKISADIPAEKKLADIAPEKEMADSTSGNNLVESQAGQTLTDSFLLDEVSDSAVGLDSGIFSSLVLEEKAKDITPLKVEQEAAVTLALKASSYFGNFGDYAYTTGASVLSWADFIARNKVTAFLIAYKYMGYFEDPVAKLGYTAVSYTVGFTPACVTYLGIKTMFLFPGILAYVHAGEVQKVINGTLDMTQVVALEAATRARSLGSYMWSNWVYA
jgi:hypothetical protein